MTLLTSGSGGIRVEWEADPSAHAYQISYSQDKSFSTYHSTTVTDISRTYVNLTNVPRAGETWLYAETVPSPRGRLRSYTLTAEYLLSHKYTWDRSKYMSA